MNSKLPKIKLPTYEMTLPVSGLKVTYHPFSVREEKMMIMTQESEDFDEAIRAAKQVINNCIVDVNVSDLPLADVEYALINLRSKSVNDKISFTIKDPETDEEIKLVLDLNNVEIDRNPSHTNIINGEGYKIIMRYPNIDDFADLVKSPNDKELEYSVLLSCLESLVNDEGEVFKFDDFSDDEINEFVEGLPGESLQAMKEFFLTLPSVKFTIPYKRPSDGVERKFVIEGIRSFFV